MDEEVVAILIKTDILGAIQQYLVTKPFNEVAGILEALKKCPGVTKSQIDSMVKE